MGTNFPSQLPAYIQSGNPATENRAADSYSPGQLGAQFSWIVPNTPTTKWQLIQADSVLGTAIAAGAVLYWRNSTGYVVTTDPAIAGRNNVAGVAGALIDVTNIGCVQQEGPASVQIQTTPTSTPDNTGKQVIPSATAGKADVLAAGTAASYQPLGRDVGFLSGGLATVQLSIPGRP